jgi:hypothetical protein
MNDEYIKKLEDQNKLLEETLSKYKEKFGELEPTKLSPVWIDNDNIFSAQSANGNFLTINDNGIGFKANNITIDAQSIVSTVESEALKEIRQIKKFLENTYRKPKPRLKRYCKFLIRKFKRKFK